MIRRFVAIALVLALLYGCNWAPSLGVYKLEIVQGNLITQDMVERLKVGMTRSQVRTALGTPLVVSAFHGDRWDYVYERRRQGRLVEHHDFRVFFADDRLARWEGSELPQSPMAARRAGDTGALPGVSVEPADSNWFEDLREKFRDRFGW